MRETAHFFRKVYRAAAPPGPAAIISEKKRGFLWDTERERMHATQASCLGCYVRASRCVCASASALWLASEEFPERRARLLVAARAGVIGPK
jgi:hypothetical protein